MSYRKRIVCLAKSIKHGGYCIAGKELVGGQSDEWIRPVSDREDEEIARHECSCHDGHEPELLDKIIVPFLEARPHGHQKENHLIDTDRQWRLYGRLTWEELESLVDYVDGPLWVNGYSSTYGLNDQVPESIANGVDYSLLLVRPRKFEICVETEGWLFPKRKLRAAFRYKGFEYKLAFTDPAIKDRFWARVGRHRVGDEVLICVSLGEVFKGHAYKLVAAVLTPDLSETR